MSLLILTPLSSLAQDKTEPAPIVTALPTVVIPSDVTAGTPIILTQPAAPPAESSPLFYLIVVVLALLLVASNVYNGRITSLLATLVPPETAASIYQSGVRLGLQMALNQAAKTASPLDDEFFTEMARLRGLEAIKDPVTGIYDVRNMQPPTAPATVG